MSIDKGDLQDLAMDAEMIMENTPTALTYLQVAIIV